MTGNPTWKVSSTQGSTKRADEKIRQVRKLRRRISSDWFDISVQLRLTCCEMSWLYVGKADYKTSRGAFTVIYPTNYLSRELYLYRIWSVMTNPERFTTELALSFTHKWTNPKYKLPGLALSPGILNPEFKVGPLIPESFVVQTIISRIRISISLRSFEFAVEPNWRPIQ